MKHTGNIRIKDIARMAGVSVGTVDRVLHNRGKVSADALAKVDEVLKTINYKPNLIARSLGKGRKQRIVVLIPNPTADAYWQEVNLGIQQAEEEWVHYGTSIETYFYVHDGEEALEKIALEILKTSPDGLVMAPIFHPQAMPVIKVLREQNIPYVLINTNIPESNPLSFIGQDLFQSGKLAGRLMSLGKGGSDSFAILHIGEDINDSVYLMEKERGFRSYFQGCPASQNMIQSHNLNQDLRAIPAQIEKILDNESLKGVYVTTSKALGIVAAILATHPRKSAVQLIGYDMLEENLHYLKQNVITFLINQNPKRQSFVGISHMANHLLFKRTVPTTELFPLEIITQQNLDSYLSSSIH